MCVLFERERQRQRQRESEYNNSENNDTHPVHQIHPLLAVLDRHHQPTVAPGDQPVQLAAAIRVGDADVRLFNRTSAARVIGRAVERSSGRAGDGTSGRAPHEVITHARSSPARARPSLTRHAAFPRPTRPPRWTLSDHERITATFDHVERESKQARRLV